MVSLVRWFGEEVEKGRKKAFPFFSPFFFLSKPRAVKKEVGFEEAP